MLKAISPFWDGNEVWLVLVGAGLFSAFPLVYAIVLPAFYLPLTLMLLALIFRGVAFAFRRHAARPEAWDWTFGCASLMVPLIQGTALGAILQGIPVAGNAYAGGAWTWLSPLALACGAALAMGDCLLAAAWLILKTEGEVRKRAYGWVKVLLPAWLVFLAGIGAWLVTIQPRLSATALESGWAWLPLLLGLAALAGLWGGLRRGNDRLPYALASLLFLAGFVAVGLGLWPYVLPFSVTIAQAAAPAETLRFLTPGAVIVFPLVLLYSGIVAWLMRGKV